MATSSGRPRPGHRPDRWHAVDGVQGRRPHPHQHGAPRSPRAPKVTEPHLGSCPGNIPRAHHTVSDHARFWVERPRGEWCGRGYGRVNTAWTVIVLRIEAMRIWFQVRPKSARLTWISPSSHVSPSALETVASKDTGRVWSRTVRLPVTLTPPLPGLMPSTVNVMSGWLAASKKSAERRCSSRFLFLVSTDRAATVMVPVTSPAADTVPFPVTSRKTPLTGASPHMLLLFSRTSDLAVSSVQVPARFPSCISAWSADDVSCPDGAMCVSLSIWFRNQNYFD